MELNEDSLLEERLGRFSTDDNVGSERDAGLSFTSPDKCHWFDDETTKVDVNKILYMLKSNPGMENDANATSGKTLLHYICEKNFLSIVVYLLKRQVNIDTRGERGLTVT